MASHLWDILDSFYDYWTTVGKGPPKPPEFSEMHVKWETGMRIIKLASRVRDWKEIGELISYVLLIGPAGEGEDIRNAISTRMGQSIYI